MSVGRGGEVGSEFVLVSGADVICASALGTLLGVNTVY